MPDIGVLICGHGSRDTRGTAELAVLAGAVARRFPHWTFDHGFLEFAEPTIADGLRRLAAAGAKTIIAVPGLLFSARHARIDIPTVLRDNAPPGVEIRYADPLGFDPKLLRAAADRIEEAEAGGGADILRGESLLMVAGRGTSDAEANGDLAKLTRLLSEGMEFGWGVTSYAGVTEPQPPKALDQAAKLGYRRIVVMPYFLFSGALADRVYKATDEAAARYPQIEFVKAPYLNAHPLIVETFSDRIIQALERSAQHHDQRHDRSHDHDNDDCGDDWHNHAPVEPIAPADIYALAPRNRADGR
jgi:sirohydrochlorin cobaltochelatase